MKNTFSRKALTWCLIMLGIGIAYSGHLYIALAMGTLATIVAVVDDLHLFGDEEEPNEEEL